MKTGIILISALLGSSSAMMAQNYLAYTKTNLELLDSSHAPIKHIEQGEAVYVQSEKPEHGLYKVVHLKSKKEGFVSKHDIKIHREASESEVPMMISKNSHVKDPIIELHNSSKHPLIVKFDDMEFELGPHETQTIKHEKGSYYYKVYAHDMEAHYEHAKLQDYKKYEWDFYVEDEPVSGLGFTGHHSE